MMKLSENRMLVTEATSAEYLILMDHFTQNDYKLVYIEKVVTSNFFVISWKSVHWYLFIQTIVDPYSE